MKSFYILNDEGLVVGSGTGVVVPDNGVEVVSAVLPKPPSAGMGLHYETGTWKPLFPAEAQWSAVRRERQVELNRSDWTQLPDNNLSVEKRQEWADYRQALREITNQADPFSIVWPVSPV